MSNIFDSDKIGNAKIDTSKKILEVLQVLLLILTKNISGFNLLEDSKNGLTPSNEYTSI